MQQSAMIGLALAMGLVIAADAAGQRVDEDEREAAAQATSIDQQTGKILNEAIELLNMENYTGAKQRIDTLALDKLSPYERGKVEQILFNIAYSQERFDAARVHLQNAIASGGLNAQEIGEARYQGAQLYMLEQRYREAAAALEEWFKTATNPNSSAYYFLAAAYYELDDAERALPPAIKAVELMDPAKPNESWLGMLSALYLQREQYREAIPIVQQLIAASPDNRAYWLQLSGVYGQIEDYANALAILQLASNVGLVTEDPDIRRLADLLVYNGVPYRGAQVLEAAIERRAVTLDDKAYEKLANCWIAAGELDKSVAPLTRAAELAATGDAFVRLGELHVQRGDWTAAVAAVQRGVEKGELKDPGNADLMLGIAHYSQKRFEDAAPFFRRARLSDRHRPLADSYLQAIQAQN